MAFVSNLEIIQVEQVQTVPTKTGFYRTVGVAFRTAEGKVEGKKFVSFNNEEIFNQVVALKQGDKITVTQEKKPGKDGKEYWHWVGIGGATAGVATPAITGGEISTGNVGRQSGSTTGRVAGSNYETPEERAAKQRNITRQFSINASLKITELNKSKVDKDEMFKLAKEIENYVYSEEANQTIIDMPDDLPI